MVRRRQPKEARHEDQAHHRRRNRSPRHRRHRRRRRRRHRVSSTAAKAPTTASTAATRHVEGRVTAIDRSARTFTVRDAERGTLKVKVTSSTKFERVTFSSLRTGTRVDVRAKRVAGAWNATKVERGERERRRPPRRR